MIKNQGLRYRSYCQSKDIFKILKNQGQPPFNLQGPIKQLGGFCWRCSKPYKIESSHHRGFASLVLICLDGLPPSPLFLQPTNGQTLKNQTLLSFMFYNFVFLFLKNELPNPFLPRGHIPSPPQQVHRPQYFAILCIKIMTITNKDIYRQLIKYVKLNIDGSNLQSRQIF